MSFSVEENAVFIHKFSKNLPSRGRGAPPPPPPRSLRSLAYYRPPPPPKMKSWLRHWSESPFPPPQPTPDSSWATFSGLTAQHSRQFATPNQTPWSSPWLYALMKWSNIVAALLRLTACIVNAEFGLWRNLKLWTNHERVSTEMWRHNAGMRRTPSDLANQTFPTFTLSPESYWLIFHILLGSKLIQFDFSLTDFLLDLKWAIHWGNCDHLAVIIHSAAHEKVNYCFESPFNHIPS